MYVHGFIDGALVVVVIEMVAAVIGAVVYTKKKGK